MKSGRIVKILLGIVLIIVGIFNMIKGNDTKKFNSNLNGLSGNPVNKNQVLVIFNNKCNTLAQTGLVCLLVGLLLVTMCVLGMYNVSKEMYIGICIAVLLLPVIIAVVAKKV